MAENNEKGNDENKKSTNAALEWEGKITFELTRNAAKKFTNTLKFLI